MLTSKRSAETDVKNDTKTLKSSYWRHARESSYTPHVRRQFLAQVGFTEIPVGFARIIFPRPIIVSWNHSGEDKDLLESASSVAFIITAHEHNKAASCILISWAISLLPDDSFSEIRSQLMFKMYMRLYTSVIHSVPLPMDTTFCQTLISSLLRTSDQEWFL